MKKYNSSVVLLVLPVLLLLLPSCMGMMMVGGHGDHNEHQATTISKEVTNGDYTLSVSLDPMTTEKSGNITISLRSKNIVPESVAVHYMISKSPVTGSMSGHDHDSHSASSEEFKTVHQNIFLIKGVSTIAFTPTVAENFVLTVEIEKRTNVDAPLSLETPFPVHQKKSRGMMGMGAIWDYPVIGVLVMGTMMIGMWAIRGTI